jgi:prevent-host-death family protein
METMAIKANVHEAKTHFSELLERAHNGEEVIIAKAGKPYARLVPIVEAVDRQPGAFRGLIAGDVLGRVKPDDAPWG